MRPSELIFEDETPEMSRMAWSGSMTDPYHDDIEYPIVSLRLTLMINGRQWGTGVILSPRQWDDVALRDAAWRMMEDTIREMPRLNRSI